MSNVVTNPKVVEIIERARVAQKIYNQYSQEQVDEVVLAAAWVIMQDKNNIALSKQAVADTGIGNVEDKKLKNQRKTLGLLRDLKGVKTVGVVAEDSAKGIIEIARPVGVVGAIVPSTNPVATPLNKTLNALKCRNAIVLAPSPKGQKVADSLLDLIHAELDRVDAPKDLVQKLPSPVNKADTQQMMQLVDLLVVTGSQNNVRAAVASGTPAVGVGAGNVVSIVDETADLAGAASKIITSKAFDNATSCSSENQLVIVDAVREQLLAELTKNHAYFLTADEQDKLQSILWQEGKLNHDLIAKSAYEIGEKAGLNIEPNVKILMVAGTGIGKGYPFSGEKLSPVLNVYAAQDFAAACEIANDIMDYQGKGHSLSIHSTNQNRILELGLTMPVCRVIVNQIHCYATGGSFDNGLPFSLSMGCGTWGKNIISDNMNYSHYLNTTRIASKIPPVKPKLAEIFSEFWQKYNIKA